MARGVSTGLWAIALQWARLGSAALLLLLAARFLSLAEIGLFAVVFAPVRAAHMALRGAVIDAGVVLCHHQRLRSAAWVLALAAGGGMSLAAFAGSAIIGGDKAAVLTALAALPFLGALGTLPEARLRRRLRIRLLAMRAMVANGLALCVAAVGMMAGWGVWALVAFSLISTTLASALALALLPSLPRVWPRRHDLMRVWHHLWPLALRDLVAGAPLPLLQVAVGAFAGLPAAGAFQIAARFAAVLDGLFVAPMRYVALPLVAHESARTARFLTVLGQAGVVAGGLFPLAYGLAPILLPWVIGQPHTAAVLPLVPAFCLLGALGAVAMPFVQGATVLGRTDLAVFRAGLILGMAAAFGALMAPFGDPAMAVWALCAAAALANLWFATRMLRAGLAARAQDVITALAPGLGLAGLILCVLHGAWLGVFSLAVLGGLTLRPRKAMP